MGGGFRLDNRQRSSDNLRARCFPYSRDTVLGVSRATIELRHMDARHFVNIECRRMAKGCALKCGCIGLMLFRNLLMSGHNTE